MHVNAMDPIGIRETQSLLRTVTQRSLSHFHTAGMNNTSISNRQVPSIADGMESRYTSKNTSMTFQTSFETKELKRAIVGKDMLWFVRMVRGSYLELPDEENLWYEVNDQSNMFSDDNPDEVIIRFYIDYLKLIEYDLTLKALAVSCFGDAPVTVSPDFLGMIDLKVEDGYVLRWLEQMGNTVCGTPDIVSAQIEGHVAVTGGSSILAVSRENRVDKKTLQSNHVADVEKHLGIEAAAYALDHIIDNKIVSDFMTRTGKVLPFSKYSKEINRRGILISAGLERPRNDIRAAIISKKWDAYSSVYADIMVGKSPGQLFALHS